MEEEEEEAAAAPFTQHKSKFENGHIPSDSLLQIWSRLPTPSLYRFRSVCHLWNTLITTDVLLPTLRHRLPSLKPQPQPPTLLLILRHSPSEPVKHPDRPARLSIQPASSILLRPDPNPVVPTHPIQNGFTPYIDSTLNLLPSSHLLSPLICFSSHLYFYLSNPSINRFLRITPGHSPSTHHSAFGYFRHHNRYALVNIQGTHAESFEFGPGQAGSAKWIRIHSPSPAPVRDFGIMVDGFFFWTASTAGLGFVVCLDYHNSKFTLIPPPQGNPGEVMLYDQMRLVGFKGSVCAVDNFSRPPRMEVWVLLHSIQGGDQGFSWVRKYNVYMTGMSRDLVYPFCDYYFYDHHQVDEDKKREKNENIVLCNGTRSRLYSYNLKTRSVRQVYKPKQRSFEQLALYTPGLFPLTIAD